MTPTRTSRVIQGVAAAGAVLFGALTIFAGGRVLLGTDPGYVVFRPLLIYNTAMGVAYIAAGIAIWRSITAGRNSAGVIFVLNLAVLVEIAVLYRLEGDVAVDSLRAMSLRTVVWFVLFAVSTRIASSRNAAKQLEAKSV